MSFRNLQNDIENVFADPTRIPTGLQIIPANYSGSITSSAFARLNIFAPQAVTIGYDNATTIGGFVEFNIFVEEGIGLGSAHDFADELNEIYSGVMIGSTQFTQGSIATKAVDTVNPNLFRVDLRIPFTRYN